MPARIRLTPDQLDFRRYLLEVYPEDLRAVAMGVRRLHRSIHLEPDDGILLQPMHLNASNSAIREMTPTLRDSFAVGLAWQVWFDEAAWCWHRDRYAAFRERTLFPKLVGDCPGGCSSHQPPMAALRWVGADRHLYGPSLETRLARNALLAWTVTAVESIAQDLSDEVPLLLELFERGLAEFRITRPEHRIPPDDLLPTTPVRSWRMPRIPGATLREIAAARCAPRHGPEPAGRPARPVRSERRELAQEGINDTPENGDLFER